MDKEQLLSQINDGRTASVLLQWMHPIFKEVEDQLIGSLKSNFRQGSYSELLLACHVAQLCALDDLRTKIKGIAVRGNAASESFENDQGEVDGN